MSIPDCPIIENLPNKKYNFNADSIHQEGCFLENLFLTKNYFFKVDVTTVTSYKSLQIFREAI